MHSYGHAQNRRKSQKSPKIVFFCDFDQLWGSVASTPLLCWFFFATWAICILKIGKIGVKGRALYASEVCTCGTWNFAFPCWQLSYTTDLLQYFMHFGYSQLYGLNWQKTLLLWRQGGFDRRQALLLDLIYIYIVYI